MADDHRNRVLFPCTGNSCRSQMAKGQLVKGLSRELRGDRFEALSAGSSPTGYVHPGAIQLMAELEIDISNQGSKSINESLAPNGTPPNTTVSVCSGAEHDCPVFPGNVNRLHWPFDDPAHAEGTEEEKLACSRRVRDEIRTALTERLL